MPSDLLARAGQELSTSLDYQATLKNVTGLIVPILADDCFIFLKKENGDPELVASAHSDAEGGELVRESARRLDPLEHPHLPLLAVLSTGVSALIQDFAQDSGQHSQGDAMQHPARDHELLRVMLKRARSARASSWRSGRARGDIIGTMCSSTWTGIIATPMTM